jgi:proteic killer suppression protein
VKIVLTNIAKKQLDRCPDYIARKYDYWVDLLQTVGLREARKYKGFHDEPLHGNRRGQRSVRLSKSYRIIYRELDGNRYEVIKILEVNKHEY